MEITVKMGYIEVSHIDLFIYARLDSTIKDINRR